MLHLKQSILLVFGSLLIAGTAWAQVNRGTITGIVTDSSGGVIPDVAIKITNTVTGVSNNVTSNSSGVYTVPSLPPSTYQIAAQKTGFQGYQHSNIVLNVGETVRLDFVLTVGLTTQTVTVTAQASMLKRESSDMGTAVTTRDVEDLPLTSIGDQRTPATFMQLAPGVTGEGNSTGGPGSGRTMTTSVSGGMVSSTTLAIDGADIPTPNGFEGDLRALQLPPDAIEEFKLQATNGSAEFGRSEGGSASFQIKSGTNQIHGSAYEWVRNDALNAVPWFQNFSPAGCDSSGHSVASGATQACRPRYNQNEFGVTAGGPIKKDNAFIFGYYDGFRLILGQSGSLQTVPTQQMLQGNFTNYGVTNNGAFTMTPLYDPATRQACPTTGPYAGMICNNIIQPQAFDRVSKLVIPLIPAPTDSNPRDVVNNFSSNTENPLSVNEWGLKGDYIVNNKSRLSGAYVTGKNTTPNNPTVPAPLGGGAQPSINLTRNARVNWNFTPKGNVTNQATLAWDAWDNGQQALSSWAGKSDWSSYLGIGGTAPNLPTEFPQIVINGISWNGGGGAAFGNQHYTQFNDSLTWLKGKHTAKFGMAYMKGGSNNLSTGRSAGYFNFTNLETGLSGQSNTGIAAASFLLGYADEAQVQHINAPSYSRDSYFAAFAQDDFKMTKKLTLNLGVRWDLFLPDFQKYYHKAWVDYSVPNPGANNILGAFVVASPQNPTGLNTYYRNFSPRVGLAYSVTEKTVIRAAYGIFYAQGNANMLDNGDFVQGFNGNVDITSTNGGQTPGFIWGTGTVPGFTPTLAPTAFLGGGTPYHSAGVLIAMDKTDSLAPYAQNYTFDVEHQLPSNTLLSVAFVGNKGTHTSSRLTPWDKMPPQYLVYGNQTGSDGKTSLLNTPIGDPLVQVAPPIASMTVDPATGHKVPFTGFEALYGTGATMGQALRTAPQYAGTHRYFESLGVSDYDALQVKLDKRFSNGLQLLVSYAWSKWLTDGGAMFSTFSSDFATTNPWNRRTQKTYNFQDIPNNLSIAYMYELPLGKGKHFMNRGGVPNAVLGGWKTSGILRYFSGTPQEIEGAGTSSGLEDNNWTQANQVPGVPMRSSAFCCGHKFDPGKGDIMLNPAAFAQPPQWTFGTLTPNEATVRNFAWPNEDMSLIKEWQIHESWSLRFNADFFNIFNRHVFGDNNGAYSEEWTVGQPGFGTVYNTVDNPRLIQFGLNLRW